MAVYVFNVVRVATSAATQVTTAPAAVTARLVAGAAAARLDIHNGQTTSASSRVAALSAAASGADELSVPVRCPDGVRVKLSVGSAEAFIYVE